MGQQRARAVGGLGIPWSGELDGAIYAEGSTDLSSEGYDPKLSKPPAIPFSDDRRDTAHAFE